ncbi:MAG TPA: ArsA-related P-loop ATPase [Myxococcota bacterium]|nr:ArsA-related P-loop ATPase [Myxococcota bacterium]
MNLGQSVLEKRIIVSMGPGGVGKTTLAATLGLQAAVMGRRALVLTIDPAMRLASALGLAKLEAGQTQTLTVGTLEQLSVRARVPLDVVMLDTGRSLKELIAREVSDPERRTKILTHPFFRRLCEDLAGSREYAAMEDLYHLYMRGEYDLVVVDTPPTIHGMDFLDAPDRILDVLDDNGYRWLMRPALLAGKIGLLALDFSGGYIVKILSKFTGLAFLKELATFIDLFSGLMEGFRERAAALKEILRSDSSSFVLVSSPDASQSQEVLALHRRLTSRDLAPEVLVVNRVSPAPPPLPQGPTWRQLLVEKLTALRAGSQEQVERSIAVMERAQRMLQMLADRDLRRVEELRRKLADRSSLVNVALLEQDVHDIAGLERLRRSIFDRRE